MSDKKNIVIGIDLGTTYSAVAYVDEYGESKIIPNDKNERITPSVVFFESDKNIIVGQNAKDEYELSPDKVVAFVKRNMGRKKETANKDGMPYSFYGKTYAPEEISALILKQLKQDAERFFGGTEMKDVVITVPA
ncbi:MAG: Hsp70 family protein, partial [Saprospiraceae bacterium]|nr:Hsp70 family protein [Saprospiraceae bacterium]